MFAISHSHVMVHSLLRSLLSWDCSWSPISILIKSVNSCVSGLCKKQKVYFEWKHWALIIPFLGPTLLWRYFLSCTGSLQDRSLLSICISNLNVDSRQPFIQSKKGRLKKRLIFQLSESSLCADILIVCFTSFEQWGSVQFVGSHAFHYTTPLWQRQLRGKNEPRDESSVWLELCGSNMDKSLVLTVCPLTHGKDLWQVVLMEPHTFSKECFVSRLWSHI